MPRQEKRQFKFDRIQQFVNGLIGKFVPKAEQKVEKTEQKVEEPKVEVPKPSFDGFPSVEERNLSYANYLSDMFERDISLMLKYVDANPKLAKCELAEKWIE